MNVRVVISSPKVKLPESLSGPPFLALLHFLRQWHVRLRLTTYGHISLSAQMKKFNRKSRSSTECDAAVQTTAAEVDSCADLGRSDRLFSSILLRNPATCATDDSTITTVKSKSVNALVWPNASGSRCQHPTVSTNSGKCRCCQASGGNWLPSQPMCSL